MNPNSDNLRKKPLTIYIHCVASSDGSQLITFVKKEFTSRSLLRTQSPWVKGNVLSLLTRLR